MHGERQVERRFVFGLLWPHISPLQMNINKELLISAACAVRAYVCMRGRRRGVPCEQAFLHLLALLLLLFRTTTCICGTSFLPPFLLLLMRGGSVLVFFHPIPIPFILLRFVLAVCHLLLPFKGLIVMLARVFITIKYSVAYFFWQPFGKFHPSEICQEENKICARQCRVIMSDNKLAGVSLVALAMI